MVSISRNHSYSCSCKYTKPCNECRTYHKNGQQAKAILEPHIETANLETVADKHKFIINFISAACINNTKFHPRPRH